jgi:hypothetical protein
MKNWKQRPFKALATVLITMAIAGSMPGLVAAQEAATVLAGAELLQVVPPGFYFQGRSAPVQMRNAAAARFGSNRYVIAGLVDTAGYAADVREKYQGFFVTDSPITVGGSDLGIGAYGFGFSNDGKFVIMDLSGKELLSVTSPKDDKLARPRPLMMKTSADGLQLYGGRRHVTIALK